MQKPGRIPFARSAVLALAEIKAAVEAFDQGDANLFDALDEIFHAVEAYRSQQRQDPRHDPRRRDAA